MDSRVLYIGYFDRSGNKSWGRPLDFPSGVLQDELRWRSKVDSQWIAAYTPEGKAKGLSKAPGKEPQMKGGAAKDAASQSLSEGNVKGKGKGKEKRTVLYSKFSRRLWRTIVRESFEPYRRCEDPTSCACLICALFQHSMV